MKKYIRRQFISSSITTAAGISAASVLQAPIWANISGANDDIRVAVVGFHNKARQHISQFSRMPGVRLVALCDVDKQYLESEAKRAGQRNETIDTYVDYRKLPDDKNIDAVVIAAADHWHALMTIWDIGTGEMGNLDCHVPDDCRWTTGITTLPPRTISLGGRFGYVDDGQTPNTNIVFFDHQANFIEAMRSRKPGDLRADIVEGHISAAMCHIANISYLLAQKQPVEQIRKEIQPNDMLTECFERFVKHLQANEINLDKTPFEIGPTLTIDADSEKFTGRFSEQANKYLSRN